MEPRKRIATLDSGVIVLEPLAPEVLLDFILPELPPSDNHLYLSVGSGKRKKRILTTEGKAFKNGIKESLTAVHQAAGMPIIDKSMMLSMIVTCRIPHLFTQTEAAENWFRIVDAHNRGKVLFDAVAEHFGIQDAQVFYPALPKCEGEPATHVVLSRMYEQPPWPAGC